jgi:hypothetical protein
VTGTLLWLVAIAALSLAAAFVLRRVASLAGGTHELERLQSDVVSIHERLTETVEPLVGRLDEVRRGVMDPALASTEVDAARATLRTLSRQAHELKGPTALADRVQQLVWEVDRAVRAADMAGHGISQMGRARHDVGTEAHTALKRGTLGLRHAREATARIMMSVARLTPAEVRAMPRAPASSLIVTPPTDEDLLVGPDEPPEHPDEPTM